MNVNASWLSSKGSIQYQWQQLYTEETILSVSSKKIANYKKQQGRPSSLDLKRVIFIAFFGKSTVFNGCDQNYKGSKVKIFIIRKQTENKTSVKVKYK